jgi:hypothetical protein
MRLSKFLPFLSALTLLLATVVVDAQQNAPALAGRWQGTLIPKAARNGTASRELGSTRGVTKMPVAVTIMAATDGTLTGTWASTGQQGATPVEIAIDGDTIRFTMPAAMASWEGKLSADGSTLDGKWQGKTFGGDARSSLVLRRDGS